MKTKISLLFIYLLISFNLNANLSMHLIGNRDSAFTDNNFKTLSMDLFNDYELKESLSKNILSTNFGNLIIYNPEVFISYNSEVAHSYNDGTLWQGRGFNNKTALGIEFYNNSFSFRLYPELVASQNSDFEIIETSHSSGYGDYWTKFDNLQRFGDSSYYELTLGQSDIRYYYKDIFTLGVSNENISIGPGIKNNIILGSQGATFPHIDFGTLGFIPFFSLGEVEYRVLYGFLEESDYFDDDSSNDYGWYSGFTAGFKPAILSNFTIGLNHFYTKPLSDWESADLLRHVPGLDISNSPVDLKDTVVSLTFSFKHPDYGFNFYGEIARNDHFYSPESLWRDPEHTSGYTLGIRQKLYSFSNRSELTLSFEHTDLMQTRTYETGAAGPWYRHGWAGWTQGYTNRGQLLGSSIGPGSNSQWLELSYVYQKGLINLSFQRIAHDKDYYYHLYPDGVTRPNTDVRQYTEAIIAVESLRKFESFDIFGKFAYNPHIYPGFKLGSTIHNLHLLVGFNYKF